MLSRVFTLFSILVLASGFKCSASGDKPSNLTSAKVEPTTQPRNEAPAAVNNVDTVSGTLQFGIDTSLGIAFVDKLEGESAVIRVWDTQHENSPEPSKQVNIEEFMNAMSGGNYMKFPRLYVQISGVSCTPEQDVDFACSQLELKVDEDFVNKIRHEPDFRARLGRMLGSPISVKRSNPVFSISDVK